MGKLFSQTARSTLAVGISGFLPEEASVFYAQLFNTYGIGRVSDLLTARLRKDGWSHELGARAVLLLGSFESRNAVDSDSPISLETGTSDDQLVIGFSFISRRLTETEVLESIGRIQAREPQTEFDFLIEAIRRFSDSFMIRVHDQKSRVDFIIGLDRDPAGVLGSTQCELEQATIPLGSKVEMKVRHYEELGDLDHAGLLDVEKTKSDQETQEEKDFKISGKTKDTKESSQNVKGQKEEVDKTERTIKGDAAEEEQSTEVKGIGGLLKKVWPFKKSKKVDVAETAKGEPQVEATEDSSDEVEEEVIEVKGQEPKADRLQRRIKGEKSKDETEEETLKGEKEKELEKIVVKDNSAATVRANGVSEEDMIKAASELMSEKAKLIENARALDKTMKQKELEFKNKEQAMRAELRKSEDALKLKESSIAHLKEQNTKMMTEIDKHREANKNTSTGESSLKNKIQQSQQALATEKRKAEEAQKKLEETRAQLATLQLSSKAQKNASGDADALKDKLARAHKDSDDLKRQIRELQDKVKVSDKKDSLTPEQQGELKAKLEASTRASVLDKKNVEKLSRQVEEMKREEIRMKVENSRLQGELKRAKHLPGAKDTQSPLSADKDAKNEPPKDGSSGSQAA